MRFALLLALLLCAPAVLAADWGLYRNARFGYAVGIPPGFAGEGESANGDGQAFRSADGTQALSAWGGIVLERSFEAAAQTAMGFAREDGWALSYERVTPSWASWSGRRNGMILYARMIALCGGSRYAAFQLEYAERDVGQMDLVVDRLVASLRATGSGAGC